MCSTGGQQCRLRLVLGIFNKRIDECPFGMATSPLCLSTTIHSHLCIDDLETCVLNNKFSICIDDVAFEQSDTARDEGIYSTTPPPHEPLWSWLGAGCTRVADQFHIDMEWQWPVIGIVSGDWRWWRESHSKVFHLKLLSPQFSIITDVPFISMTTSTRNSIRLPFHTFQLNLERHAGTRRTTRSSISVWQEHGQ